MEDQDLIIKLENIIVEFYTEELEKTVNSIRFIRKSVYEKNYCFTVNNEDDVYIWESDDYEFYKENFVADKVYEVAEEIEKSIEANYRKYIEIDTYELENHIVDNFEYYAKYCEEDIHFYEDYVIAVY